MNKKLKAKIIERYGTQADFAQAIDIDETFISKIIRGRRTLQPEKKALWAKTLRCRPRDIFADEI